jgi:hypothetical protein
LRSLPPHKAATPCSPNVPSGLFPGVSLRPNVTGPLTVTGSPVQWFSDPSVYTSPCTTVSGITTCSPGDMGRNSVIGPDFVDTDLSLIRDTKIWERMNLQFRADAFDVFNHPNFGNPNLSVGSTTFGTITSTRFANGDYGSARQLQLALKLEF